MFVYVRCDNEPQRACERANRSQNVNVNDGARSREIDRPTRTAEFGLQRQLESAAFQLLVRTRHCRQVDRSIEMITIGKVYHHQTSQPAAAAPVASNRIRTKAKHTTSVTYRKRMELRVCLRGGGRSRCSVTTACGPATNRRDSYSGGGGGWGGGGGGGEGGGNDRCRKES
jgi:hypothetical protein